MKGHHPPHIYLDNTWYIITASTIDHARFLSPERAKAFVRDQLKSLIIEFGIKLLAWAILDNHYHLLLQTRHGLADCWERYPVVDLLAGDDFD